MKRTHEGVVEKGDGEGKQDEQLPGPWAQPECPWVVGEVPDDKGQGRDSLQSFSGHREFLSESGRCLQILPKILWA